MEALGVPWFIAVRLLGPPVFLLVAGGALLLWRRPPRPGPIWAALAVNLLAAALPFLWIGVQVVVDQAERTVYGLVMTLVQPSVSLVAWGLLLWAAVFPGRAPVGAAAVEEDGLPEHAPQNVG
ncbi:MULTISPECIES: hypothetical protein [unclassified Nocardiopsis]|uniref:hypothetical protein n=1 Tax=Nocardiopsis TaxID=2013 RepID=UPI00387A8C08